MLLSVDSAQTVKVQSAMMLSLTIASLISPAQASEVTCTPESPQCCWVVRIWQLMGKSTLVDHTSATACCSMSGVTCSGSTVTKIYWSFRGIRGSIPPDVGNLVNLTFLSIHGNYLTGYIPSTIGYLTSLETLYLHKNQLSGPIPASIQNLVNLKVLNLGANRLSGSIPSTIRYLVNLEYLYIYETQLSGYIPASIRTLVKLRKLWLYNNDLSGSIPSTIGYLINLISLRLHENRLSGSITSDIGNLVNLQYLSLGSNGLSGAIPSSMGNLENLMALYLHRNRLSGSIPDSIGNLPNLGTLAIHVNMGLNGTFTPQCFTQVNAMKTNVTICGCASAISPPAVFPPSETPDACLATGSATSLQKRILAFSLMLGSYKFTCNVDSNGNPFQDCLNTMAQICHPDYMGTDSARINDCKNGVNSMTALMNIHWQNVRKECGQWPWYGTTGSVTSINCASANTALQQNALYITSGGIRMTVPASLTDSINKGLWSNPVLIG